MYVDNLVIARTRYGITVCGRKGGPGGERGCASPRVPQGALSALKILGRKRRAKLPSKQNAKGSRLF